MKSKIKTLIVTVLRIVERFGILVFNRPRQNIPSELPQADLYQIPAESDMIRLYRPWKSGSFSQSINAAVRENTMLSDLKLYYLQHFVRYCLHLPGDFLEAGTASGGSAYLICEAISNAGLERTLWTLDTFAGYENINAEKDSKTAHRGDVRGASASYVKQLLNKFSGSLQIIEGIIPASLAHVNTGQIAFAHIDVNLYEPTYAATCFCIERLVPSGIILFDDYSWPQTFGARLAIDEACRSSGLDVICIPESTQAFCICPPAGLPQNSCK